MSISFPSADFAPTLSGYTGQGAFRFWCQKVLPIVYDDSLSYYELLNKVVNYLNNVIADVATVENNVDELNDSYVQLQAYVNSHFSEIAEVVNTLTEYVNNYFDNLDVQQEINNKLDSMAQDGSLSRILTPIIAVEAPDVITEWLATHITPTTPIVDNTLSISGAAADSKVTGDKVTALQSSKVEMLSTYVTAIQDGSNLNDYTTPGNYAVTNNTHAGTMTNLPLPVAGKLIVMNVSNTNNVVQMYILANAEDNARIYVRYYVGESWTDWQYLVQSAGFTNIVKSLTNADATKFELLAENVTTIPDNSNLNSYTTPGNYAVTNNAHAATMTNLPVPVGGKLVVMNVNNNNNFAQIYIAANAETNARIFVRYYVGESWTDWQYLVQSAGFTNIVESLRNADATKFELLAENVTTIPDNSNLNSYTTPGNYAVTNKTHAATMANIPVPVGGKLIVMNVASNLNIAQIYIAANVETNARTFIRYWSGGSWTNWLYLIQSDSFNSVVSDVASLNKKFNIQYNEGTWADANKRLQIFVPNSTGYVLYRFYHFVNANDNCDVWRLYAILPVNDSFSIGSAFTVPGEFEMAVRLEGRPDFSGGSTHGDEIDTSFTLLVNGKPRNPNEFTNTRTPCDSIKIIRTSNVYDPNDHTTLIAEHGVEYAFGDKRMTLSQSLKWLVEEELNNCFLSMFTPSKNYIDRAVANSDFKTIELPTSTTAPGDYSIVKHNATSVVMWDTQESFNADISIIDYPTGLSGGDLISISDNSGLDYNKLYFKVCGGGSSHVGELWKSKTVYNVKY